jgi:hypothetical protein
MGGDKHLSEGRVPKPAAGFMQADNLAKHRLHGRRSKTDDNSRLDSLNLRLKPWPAGGDLSCRRLLMFAAFALRFPFEVFYGIRDIDGIPWNARFEKCFVQQFSSGTDEGMACAVFLISGLFSHHQNFGLRGAFTKYGLSGPLIKVAARA